MKQAYPRSLGARLLAGLLALLASQTALAQNVGIGTTSPTQTLDVNGNLRVRAAAGSGDGRLLGVAADGTLQAQSAPFGATAPATPQTPASLGTVSTGNNPTGVAVNPVGTRAYVVNYSAATLQTFDLTGSAPVSLGMVGTNSGPSGVAVNPAGTRAYVTRANDNTLQTFDLTGSAPVSLSTVATGNFPQGVAVNPAGTRAYVTNTNDYTLQTFDLTGSAPVSLSTVAMSGNPTAVAVNPAGTRAYVTTVGFYSFQTFDLTGSAPTSVGSVFVGTSPTGVAVNPAGTRAYVTKAGDNTLQTYDLTGSAPVVLGTVATGRRPTGVAVNPTGTRAYVVNSSDNTLQTFIIGSPRLVAVGADGTLGSVDPATLPGDNLGNHTATQQLVLAGQGVKFADGTTQTTAAAGDNLGNHTATRNLNLAAYQLVGNGGSQGLAISSTGNAGLGTTTPSQLLELGGQAAPTLLLHSSGNNLVSGATIQFREATATYGWNLRHNNGGSEGGSTDDRLVLESANGGTATPVMAWNQTSGYVGIGTTVPGTLLDVRGVVRCTSLIQTSDQRFKQAVRPLAGALASGQRLRGVRYEWNALGVAHGGVAGAGQVGMLAQELEAEYPELVSTDAQGYKAINYAQLTPVLLEALKELAARNAALEAQVAAQQRAAQTQQASLSRLDQRLRALEAAGAQASSK